MNNIMEPLIKIFKGDRELDLTNDNVDVEVVFNNGDRYSATFFTILNIQFLLDQYKKTGECSNGLYIWASDMIIVENISENIIRNVVLDLLHSGELYTSFSKIDNVLD